MPTATMFRLTSSGGEDEPSVLRSTTVMSLLAAAGAPGVSRMAPGPVDAGVTVNAAGFEAVPSGFCTVMARFAAKSRSCAERVVEQTAVELQTVARTAPPTSMEAPGP